MNLRERIPTSESSIPTSWSCDNRATVVTTFMQDLLWQRSFTTTWHVECLRCRSKLGTQEVKGEWKVRPVSWRPFCGQGYRIGSSVTFFYWKHILVWWNRMLGYFEASLVVWQLIWHVQWITYRWRGHLWIKGSKNKGRSSSSWLENPRATKATTFLQRKN